MTSDDGMGWLDAAPSEADDATNLAAETAGRSVLLALYNAVRSTFDDQHRTKGLTRKALADRLGTSPALISRWLVRPSNMTAETAGKLMYAMDEELVVCRRADLERRDETKRHNTLTLVSSNLRLVGYEIKANGGFDHWKPLVAKCLYQDAGPGLRTMTVSGSESSADGIWEQVYSHAPRGVPPVIAAPAQLETANA